jgi:hypothetical protein
MLGIGMFRQILSVVACVAASGASGDPARIVKAVANASGEVWRFDVTILHGDTGWDDYADGWRVETEAGEVLGVRALYHPHVDEQPFTRALSGVEVPQDVTTVFIRARTSVDGWGGDRVPVKLN